MSSRTAIGLSLIVAAFLLGCEHVRIAGKPPKLTRSERAIVERRKLHREETTIQRKDWRYESADDKWRWTPDNEWRSKTKDRSDSALRRYQSPHPVLPGMLNEVPPPIH